MTWQDKYINQIVRGDCLEGMRELPDESVNCVITSPPYWGLRDYKLEPLVWDGDRDCQHEWNEKYPSKLIHENRQNLNGGTIGNADFREELHGFGNAEASFCSKCDAWRGSLGLEPTFELYIKHLVEIFDEVKRILRKDGTCWVNLGDSYGGSNCGYGQTKKSSEFQNVARQTFYATSKEKSLMSKLPAKSLCLIPFRFAIEMVNRGWILRNTIIWHKPNCMPSSANDRFTVDFDYVFFFVKSKRYWFEQQFENISETYANDKRANGVLRQRFYPNSKYVKEGMVSCQVRPDHDVHFGERNLNGRNKRCVWTIPTQPFKEAHFATFPEKLVEPMIKSGCPENDIVLDPFAGAGTTCLVAKKLGRKYIGIELNPKYCEMEEKRLAEIKFIEQELI